ncbi:SHOCT domain-containing protein [Amycolatopsis sp. NPDC049252]|uniref:SHOCT domain-containing protein n=1 Tax=Amycolatopsis sp. NPDC049252 TaxID=3363933 RepID=UPI003719186B
MPYWNHMGNFGWVGGLGMLVLMGLLLTALIVVAVVLARRWQQPPTSDDTARRILDERFARGEIDREEYESRREALSRSR